MMGLKSDLFRRLVHEEIQVSRVLLYRRVLS